jgi:hypothetical protein
MVKSHFKQKVQYPNLTCLKDNLRCSGSNHKFMDSNSVLITLYFVGLSVLKVVVTSRKLKH